MAVAGPAKVDPFEFNLNRVSGPGKTGLIHLKEKPMSNKNYAGLVVGGPENGKYRECKFPRYTLRELPDFYAYTLRTAEGADYPVVYTTLHYKYESICTRSNSRADNNYGFWIPLDKDLDWLIQELMTSHGRLADLDR